jgi:hypothetical protein
MDDGLDCVYRSLLERRPTTFQDVSSGLRVDEKHGSVDMVQASALTDARFVLEYVAANKPALIRVRC